MLTRSLRSSIAPSTPAAGLTPKFNSCAYVTLAILYGTVPGELSGRSPGHSSIFHGALPPCVWKHGGQVRSIRTCQQRKETTSSPTQAPNYMLCSSDRSNLSVAPASSIRAITKPVETQRTTMQSDAFAQPALGSPSFHIARTKPFMHKTLASASGVVLQTDLNTCTTSRPRQLITQRGECCTFAPYSPAGRNVRACADDIRGPHALRHTTRDAPERVIAAAKFRRRTRDR